MYYEQFRNDLTAALLLNHSPEDITTILAAVDQTAAAYEFSRKSTDLIVVEDLPQTVKLFLASMAIENKSPRTLKNYRLTLANFFAAVQMPFDTVTTNDIRSYLYHYKIQHNIQDSAIDRIRSVIHRYYKWCVDEDYIERSPAQKIGPIKFQAAERHAMTPLELETLRHACTAPREKAVIDFLFSTGCRISEACAMQISDVNLADQTVVIRHGKGDKRRISYLNAESVVSLQAYLSSRTDTCPALFVSHHKPVHQVTPHAIQDEIKRIVNRTSLKINVTPHIFRHTAATTALRSGMPIDQVQRFLGHTNVSTTMIYAKTDDSEVKNSHQKYIA